MSLSEPLRRRGTVVVGACLVAGASVATVGAVADSAGAQQAAVVRLAAQLKPSGDPNGSGNAVFRLNRYQRTVCATVTWHRIGTPDAAHIHRNSDGLVVVDLTGSVTGGRHCASNVPRPLITRILAHPGRYYLNVHNAKYPAGAIKGTLHR
jgi:hypothetical protein